MTEETGKAPQEGRTPSVVTRGREVLQTAKARFIEAARAIGIKRGGRAVLDTIASEPGGQRALEPVGFAGRTNIHLADVSSGEQQEYHRVRAAFNRHREQAGVLVVDREGLDSSELATIQQNKTHWENEESYYDDTPSLSEQRLQIPPHVGIYFDAHGTRSVEDLNRILTRGINTNRGFDTSILRNYDDNESVAGLTPPFTAGGILLVGHPEQYIREGGVAAVIIDKPYYASVDILQKGFPDVQFIKAEDLDTQDHPGPLQQMIDHANQR